MPIARFLTGALAIPLAGLGAPVVLAQEEAVSREVVQALPSPEVTRLNHALKRLSINSRNLDALTDAGNSALALGDFDAALGFFGRALEIEPGNVPVNLGMASIYMRTEQPIEALRYFARAEQSGASTDAVASDRGLAYDLLGENTRAQESYKIALSQGGDAQTSRRLAVSYAISGDRAAFNTTLRPFVLEKDVAAYRARAFGLAILGEINEAKGLVTTVIPRDLSSRIIPYLEFMPRLTKAQQAAAANLGLFPKAAEIGRDDPLIIAYREQLISPASEAGGATRKTEENSALSDPNSERHWVQLAAGRNRSALQSDWNRLQRRAPEFLNEFTPHVVKAGRMNRLLAGPLPDRNAASELVGKLSRKRIDSFSLITRPGAKVEKLQ